MLVRAVDTVLLMYSPGTGKYDVIAASGLLQSFLLPTKLEGLGVHTVATWSSVTGNAYMPMAVMLGQASAEKQCSGCFVLKEQAICHHILEAHDAHQSCSLGRLREPTAVKLQPVSTVVTKHPGQRCCTRSLPAKAD